MSLTTKDARVILGMVARGDNKHDIAAWFGVNQARIKEVENGDFGNQTAAPAEELYPKGAPGPKGLRLRAAARKAAALLEAGDTDGALKTINDALAQYNRNEL